MDPNTVLMILALATKLVADLRAQGQLTDQQLDEFVASQDAALRDRIRAYINSVKSGS